MFLEENEMRFEDFENFLAEGTLMINFKHENVLSLVGVVYVAGKRPLVVLPYMENGDLCTFLKCDKVRYNTHKFIIIFNIVIKLKLAYAQVDH